VKASARFVSIVGGFGFGRGKVGRAVTPSLSRDAEGTGARSRRSPLALATTLLASVVLLLALAAPAANAAPTPQSGYGYLGTEFGAGEFSGFVEGVSNPITLDSHGNIFLDDEYNDRAVVFAPDPLVGGTLLTTVPLSGECGLPVNIAIDVSTDALYVQEEPGFGCGGIPIRRFVSSGTPTPTYTLDPAFEVPHGREGIAIDPTTHDLLVLEAEGISRYDTTGALASTISTPGLNPARIAVAPDGSIYISANSKIVHFSGAGALLGELMTGGGVPAVDPATGVLVVALGEHLKGYSPAGALLFETLMPISNAIGIVIDGDSGRLYAYNAAAAYTFVPAVYPGVESPVVSSITPAGAHVSAEVNPGKEPGGELPKESELCFQYQVVGAANWEPGPCQVLNAPETVQADITSLEPNLDYLVRAKASNSLTFHTSDPTSFHTTPIPPETETNAATDVSETSAVLNGTINPVDLPTTYHFEYGTTTAYGSRAPAGIEAVAGADRKDRRVGRTITGLAPGVTYHFRLVAQSSAGVNQGADRVFTTAATGGISHRAYEQVTPVDKNGIALSQVLGFQARSDGSAISYMAQASSVSAPRNSRSMSLRNDADWTSGIELDPPLNRTEPGIVGATTMAVAADFTHALIATNRKLTLDAIEDEPGRTNIYVVDFFTGTHTLVATTPSVDIGKRHFGLFNYIGLGVENFVAGAPDFSWVVFKSPIPLRQGAPEDSLYRWSVTDGLEVVSTILGGAERVFVGGSGVHPVRSVSADGSRIYFTVGGPEAGVYLWESGAPAKPISVSHIPSDSPASHPAVLIGASEDGGSAFFLSPDKLTSDAPDAGFQEGNVYRYNIANDSLEYLGASRFFNSFAADLGVAIAVGGDGQTAYWFGPDRTVLVWHNGTVNTATPSLDTEQGLSASPNGQYLAYSEGASDNAGTVGNIHLYDAGSNERRCVSCLPDGNLADGFMAYPVPVISARLPQQVTNAGQVFFTSPGRLVAADVNGMQDVYEYRDGNDRLISPGNAPFDARFADISEDGSDVFFTTPQKLVGQDNDKSVDIYDARINGGLAKQNPPPPQECFRDDCKATPNAGPELPFGGSEALSGPGNVSGEARKRCAKGTHARKVKGKTRCVKQSKANKRAKNTKRANTNRRQSR
jgi:hypothetical protein